MRMLSRSDLLQNPGPKPCMQFFAVQPVDNLANLGYAANVKPFGSYYQVRL